MILKIKGFNLIEILITLAVLSLLISLMAPGLSHLISKYQLKSQVEKFYQDLKYAQSLAINSGTNIYVALTLGPPACYGFSDQGSNCNCITSLQCTLNGASRVFPVNSLLRLTSSSNTTSFYFGALRGESSTPNPLWTFTKGNQALQIQINSLGLITVCSAGTELISDYPGC